MTLSPDALADSWSVAVLHGARRRSGEVELADPSAGLTLIDFEGIGNGGLVAMVGDINGDGVGDLGLGATGGHGLILFGRPELPLTLDGASELASGGAVELAVPGAFGRLHFAPAGDIDGDGVDDVAVGHPTSGLAGEGLGRIEGPGEVIFVAGRRAWPPRTDLSAAPGVIARLLGEAREALGRGLTQAGDVDGDGRPDLLVSTDTPRRAYLIFGSEAPPGERLISEYVAAGGGVAFDVEGGPEGEFDTPWVAGPGDVDGDGLDDVLLGFVDHHVFAGAIFLVPGSRDLPRFLELPGFPGAVEFIGPGSESQVGQVGPAGDFNGDGLADFLINSRARLGDPPGNLFVIFGAPDFPETVELASLRGRGLEIEGTVPIGSPEVVAHETGDVDGDGVSDIAFSERGINDPVGRAHVVYGLAPEADFVRGDANHDDAVNITDAVFALGFLFQGGVSPACADAVDTNDSGTLEITDAIQLLNHLFQGAVPPPPPYPTPGRDPTADALGCRGF